MVLFDLDGVLLDSTPVHRRLWERWAVRHRLDPEQVFAATFGRRPAEAIGAVAPWLVVPEELLWLDELLRRERDMFALMPGAAAAVAAARQFAAWGVVTSSSAEHATYCLTRHGIPAPIVLVGGTDTAEGKPSPAPYLLASVRAGVPSAACVAVEDSPAGVASARAAGAVAIAVASTYAAGELAAADRCLAAMDDVAQLLLAIRGQSDVAGETQTA
ncbi:MAG TPA: HAD-IA family hydrolase [Egibacteraceae bacterium]|nr:HAD-IA family hydrolase [Egibacteraceae bacterium]